VLYTTDSPILFLPANQAVTDGSGNASITVLGLVPGVAHVTASVPGNQVFFTINVLDPGAAAFPQPSGIGRIVWQGSSTVTTSTPFVATVMQNGAPAAGVTVTATVQQGSAELLNGAGAVVSQLSLVTQSDGTLAFHAQFPASDSSPDDFSIILLTAENGDSSVFLVHALPAGSPPTVQVSGSGNQVFPLVDGAPSSVPVTLTLTSAAGSPLAGVSVALAPAADSQASCSGAPAITDLNGHFACRLIVNGATGQGTLGFVLGSMTVSPSIAYQVSPAAAGLIRLISGNFQSGPSGYLLPAKLSVQVLDLYGNAVPSAPVAWQSTTAKILSATSTTAVDGTASATVQLGPNLGAQIVTVGTAGLSAEFQLTDTSLGLLSTRSGNAQIANLGEPFDTPLTVQVKSAEGQPLAGRTVAFSVSNGAASIDNPVVQTAVDGTASVNVRAGNSAGDVTIDASTEGDQVVFALQSLPPAAQSIAISDWNGHQSALTPGALMNVSFTPMGSNGFEPVSYLAPPYPTSVQGLTVSFDGVAAPILRLSGSGAATNLLVQIPWELSGRESATLQLSTGPAASTLTSLPIENIHPVILAMPPSIWRTMTLPITGLGQFAPSANTNSAGIPNQTVALPFSLSVDGIPIPILGITADPALLGVADVTIQIPFAARWRLTSTSKIAVAMH
ncbi:MAG: hypothetical protein WA324_11280, partial [Bryobacteraceae bacterium]